MSSPLDSSLNQAQQPTFPSGGPLPSIKPIDAAQTPPQGPEESTPPLAQSNAAAEAACTFTDDDETIWRAAAMALGHTSYFTYISHSGQFEQVEEELACSWDASQQSREKRISWQQAREFARDAWDQVRAALESGEAKPSAR